MIRKSLGGWEGSTGKTHRIATLHRSRRATQADQSVQSSRAQLLPTRRS